MNMKTENFELLFNGILLEKGKLSKEYSFYEIQESLIGKNHFDNLNMQKMSLSIRFYQNELFICIDIQEFYVMDLICKKFSIKLSTNSLKILNYLEVLNSLYDFNDNHVDNCVIKDKKFLPVSYIEIISERMYILSNSFLKVYRKKESIFTFVFFIRDLIESIKLYLLFLNEKSEKIQNKLTNENQDWNFDIKKLISSNRDLTTWITELREIEDINDLCNNYIHKNGLTKISPKYHRFNQEKIDWLDIWFKIIKIYFIIIATQDGRCLSSSDYVDYLDMGMDPPENSQYWVASIFYEFLKNEFSPEQIEKIVNPQKIKDILDLLNEVNNLLE